MSAKKVCCDSWKLDFVIRSGQSLGWKAQPAEKTKGHTVLFKKYTFLCDLLFFFKKNVIISKHFFGIKMWKSKVILFKKNYKKYK